MKNMLFVVGVILCLSLYSGCTAELRHTAYESSGLSSEMEGTTISETATTSASSEVDAIDQKISEGLQAIASAATEAIKQIQEATPTSVSTVTTTTTKQTTAVVLPSKTIELGASVDVQNDELYRLSFDSVTIDYKNSTLAFIHQTNKSMSTTGLSYRFEFFDKNGVKLTDTKTDLVTWLITAPNLSDCTTVRVDVIYIMKTDPVATMNIQIPIE